MTEDQHKKYEEAAKGIRDKKGMKIYRKIATIQAKVFEIGDEDGFTSPPESMPYIRTLENQRHTGQFGQHYVCLGIDHERWLVERSIFERTYIGQEAGDEEAATVYVSNEMNLSYFIKQNAKNAFLAGASHASQDTEERLKELQDENKRLRDSLSDCLTLLTECSYDATEVTEKARKLLNL